MDSFNPPSLKIWVKDTPSKVKVRHLFFIDSSPLNWCIFVSLYTFAYSGQPNNLSTMGCCNTVDRAHGKFINSISTNLKGCDPSKKERKKTGSTYPYQKLWYCANYIYLLPILYWFITSYIIYFIRLNNYKILR